jgi:CubicO group peptidase (beta-lactamase class C family)
MHFKILLLFCLTLFSTAIFSQSAYPTSYGELRKYEGVYEFTNHTTLKIAASPKDTILFAIIHKSNYPLRPFSKDVFLDLSKEKISFYRNDSGMIAGYVLNKDTFRLLNKNVFFPKQMWYPRLDPAYYYHEPKKLDDGLATSTTEQSGLSKELLNAMMKKIIAGDYPNVHSILIIKDNKLVFEEYFYEYTRDSIQELRSATKSFVSALAGIAIDKGLINKTDKVLSFFPEYDLKNMSPLKQQITIENMLANASGLDCDISNEKSEGNEVRMDYSDDWVKFTLDLPMIDTPGGKGMYCSGNPITIGRIIEKATKKPLAQFADATLFKPLGIVSYKWNFKPDKSNAEDYCQLFLTPREMAKFGLCYLNNGNWSGKQIVPANWVKESFGKHSVVQGVDYGYLWWLKYLDADSIRYYGKAAQGNGGQKIYIFSEQNLVIVITGGNYNTQSPSDELIRKYILPSFNKK